MKYPLKNILKNFLNHVEDLESRRKLNDDQYEVEFQKLKHLTDTLKWDAEYPCVHGLKEVNRPKNRYKDIVPYDFCRVILPECSGIPGTDYVNASHVKGVSGAFAYIAAQGPLPNTVIDFWRMIWVCDVQVIIMACNEREGGKTKCELYWPEKGETKQFGTIDIEFLSQTQICSDFLVRTLLVRQESDTRELWQFHYTSWPDHGVPDTVEPILEMVRLVRDCQASETAPILVHCSAGCGRTGTICAIDFIWACLRTGKLTENFHLYEIVAEMRRQRIAMVQTKEQYMLVHKAVSTMFEQQLQIIDSHTYENLDRDGTPLSWTGHPEENFYNRELSTASDGTSEVVSNVSSHQSPSLSPVKKIVFDSNTGSNASSSRSNSFSLRSHVFSPPSAQRDKAPTPPTTSPPSCDTSHDNDVFSEILSPSDNNASSLVLSSPEVADSIPFIDDDDTKSDVQVRVRCGRAYLHIPSCDSISKIVNRFDPFVDKVWTGVNDKNKENANHYHSLPTSITEQISTSETSSIVSTCGNERNSSSSILWMKRQSADLLSEKDAVRVESGKNIAEDDIKEEESSDVTTDKKGVKESMKSSFSRRPSIVKIKGFFDRSSKNKSNSPKSSLFRHHSHHVSRAGSAPPSLSSMKQNSDEGKESVFAMVSRKLRSSSVKSEHEIQKESVATSHFATLRRTAASFKQNITKFSKSITLGKSSKNQQISSPLAVEHEVIDLIQTGTQKTAELEVDSPKADANSSKDPIRVPTKTYEMAKLPPSFNYSDGRESIQQKFVVNVLSSGHGQNPLIGKKSGLYGALEKPSSPKPKHFMPDFECLRTNPVRLLSRNMTLKGANEPSSLWYNEESIGNADDLCKAKKNVTTKDSSEPTSTWYHNKSNLGEKNYIQSNDSKDKKDSEVANLPSPKDLNANRSCDETHSSSQSTFYTSLKECNKDSNLPDYSKEQISSSLAAESGKIGTSQFFWPSNNINSKTVSPKTDGSPFKFPTVNNTFEKNPVSETRVDEPSKMNFNFTSKEKPAAKLDEVIVELMDKLPKVETAPIVGRFDALTDSQDHIPQSSRLLMGLNSQEVLAKSDEQLPQVDGSAFFKPPALPKKTIIGRNKHLNWLIGKNVDTFQTEEHKSVVLVNPVMPEPVSSPVIKPVPKKLLPEKPKSVSVSSEVADTYINVNVVAQKNIEQIESTLRNHPRGAIIDLTSRQSYSMEEELTTAVEKLAEPKLPESLPPSNKNKSFAGYEKIWPDDLPQSEMKPLDKNFRENHDDKKLMKVLPSSEKVDGFVKRSGLCYSPPLRRNVISNFPVLKSRSCASLDWRKESPNSLNFNQKSEVSEKKDNNSETLVNEAVVELSTLLDQLTTKTLNDDFNEVLDSPKPNGEIGSKAADANLMPVPLKTVSPHKYETIYLPQKQALSIKNGNEEEIIFHFPPPPVVPPPPNTECVSENFNILCKGGLFHLLEASKADTGSNTDISLISSLSGELSNVDTNQNISLPTPIPRRTKPNPNKESRSLRKSASFTALISQHQVDSSLAVNDDILDHPQTLPRSQTGAATAKSSTNDEIVDEIVKISKYETVFPQIVSAANFETKGSESRINNHISIVQTEDKAVNAGSAKTKYLKERPKNVSKDTQIGHRKEHRQRLPKNLVLTTSEEPEVNVFHLPIIQPSPEHNKSRSTRDKHSKHKTFADPQLSPTRKILTLPATNCYSISKETSLIEHLCTEMNEIQQRRIPLPSRKAERAPLPPNVMSHHNLPSEDPSILQKKPHSSKTKHAPDPPLLRKSNSMKVTSSRNIEQEVSSAIPTYAVVQKSKLPSVFENLADSQSASKSRRTLEAPLYHNRDSSSSSGSGLQYSQSDASVFYALRMKKYQGKNSVESAAPSCVKTSSDSCSSDSDGTFNYMKISNEQKVQRGGKVDLPVAPPRSRRRKTVEIGFEGGAAMYRPSEQNLDVLPRVPAKTKEAFEIPEQFKAQRSRRTNSSRADLPMTMSDKIKVMHQLQNK